MKAKICALVKGKTGPIPDGLFWMNIYSTWVGLFAPQEIEGRKWPCFAHGGRRFKRMSNEK